MPGSRLENGSSKSATKLSPPVPMVRRNPALTRVLEWRQQVPALRPGPAWLPELAGQVQHRRRQYRSSR